MELDRTERRVIGALIEKCWTTPEQYPLTLNALVLACNQKSNRDPIFDLHEFEVSGALLSLRQKGLILIREKDGGRIPRYGERLSEKLGLSMRDAAILAELMLRGAQTARELLRRSSRMAPIENLEEVEVALRDLAGRGLVRMLARILGQRYVRWMHRLSPEADEPAAEEDQEPEPTAPAPLPPPPAPTPPAPTAESAPDLGEELDALRREVAELSGRVARLER